jgi:hypothetical protein
MPTLPLYTPNPGHPDASHAVIAPGGYERWYFDAESAAGDLRVVAVFSQGTADHPHYAAYRRRFRQYLLAPTRRAPPAPAEWSAVSFAVYPTAGAGWHSARSCAPGEFRASLDRFELSAGADGVAVDSDNSLRLRLGEGAAELVFRPAWGYRSGEIAWSSPGGEVPRHHWLVTAPLCAVEGTVRLDGARPVAFSGHGFHDREFGVHPVRPGLRGRVLGERRAVSFRLRAASLGWRPGFAHVDGCCVEASDEGVSDRSVSLYLKWDGPPAVIDFESLGLKLTNPRQIGRARRIRRLLYDVAASAAVGLRQRTALCEWV